MGSSSRAALSRPALLKGGGQAAFSSIKGVRKRMRTHPAGPTSASPSITRGKIRMLELGLSGFEGVGQAMGRLSKTNRTK